MIARRMWVPPMPPTRIALLFPPPIFTPSQTLLSNKREGVKLPAHPVRTGQARRGLRGTFRPNDFTFPDSLSQSNKTSTAPVSRFDPGCKASSLSRLLQFSDPNPSDKRFHSGSRQTSSRRKHYTPQAMPPTQTPPPCDH
jgi:hypothetical protein